MLSVCSFAFNAIAPILLLMVLGYALKCKQLFTIDFFKTLNRFAFHYCFMALMFCNIYELEGLGDLDLKLAAVIMGTLVIITVISVVMANLATKQRNRKGVLVQAGFRSNFAIIGMPLVEGLTGAEGLMLTASMQAFTVVYFNIISVLALSVYTDDGRFEPKVVFKRLTQNPLIRGIMLGLIALAVRELIPRTADGTLVFSLSGSLPWLYTTLKYLSRVATPIALVVLGGQFSFSAVSGIRKELIAAVLSRLVIMPAIGFSLAFAAAHVGWITITPAVVGVLIAAYGSPVAVSSAVMATEMGADDVLAGQIVVWTSVLSMVTFFLMCSGFRWFGLL